jgi:UDP-N-acetylmuramate dehydrogenase
MLKTKNNFPLTLLNTFKLTSRCDLFIQINTLAELKEFISLPEHKSTRKRILGGGSNLILSEHIQGIVLKNNLKKIEIDKAKETADAYFLNIGSGENWHQFVSWCLENKFYGMENLSLIPGTVGAAPIQNIGAYGLEVKNFIFAVKGLHLNSGIEKTLTNSQCQFEYRNSIFKTATYADFFITEVSFQIPKKNSLEYSYGELKEYFSTVTPTPELIAQKVIEIRTRKLPDLEKYPNVGSFFKNPIISKTQCDELKTKFPALVSYPYGLDQTKLSAGQLIELCHFKGAPMGAFSMYEKQALVMVNLGNGDFSQVKNLADKIIQTVKNQFGVTLEIEPLTW